ncbi:MAG: RNA polymerase sigma factor [Calditrichaeota bacterium]|nr:MAG: RNA polymerase sigma factor [Calditrichota bacterium]
MTLKEDKSIFDTLSELTDKELVLRSHYELPYESRSFKELMKRYQQKSFSKVMSMLKNEDDAKDVVQDIFIKVYNNLPKFKMNSSFSTWLYIITVNTTLNFIEKQKRKPTWWLTDDFEMEFAHQEESEIMYIMGKGVEKDEIGECIEETLDKMSAPDKKVIELRFFEELDYNTIAENIDISLSAMKMRLKRAREEFRSKFELNCMGE